MNVIKLKIRAGGQTDVGLKRDHNEDSILLSREHGLFAVADGMGGHAAGEVASKLAVTHMLDFIRKMEVEGEDERDQTAQEGLSPGEKILYLAIINANRRLCLLSEENPAYFGMGTTIAALYFSGDVVHVGHVGDSRIYLYRDGRLESLTQDHSWVNEQIQKKVLTEDEARGHRWRNVITRALGNRPDVEIDIKTMRVRERDLFLLCSDGLTTMVDDNEIAEYLSHSSEGLNTMCAEFIRRSNEAGGHDNISVVLVRVEDQSAGDDDETTQPDDLHENVTRSDITKT